MSVAALSIKSNHTAVYLSSSGEWLHHSIALVSRQLSRFELPADVVSVTWDFSDMDAFDSAGIMLVLQFMQRFPSDQVTFTFNGLKPEHQRQFLFYRKNRVRNKPLPLPMPPFFARFGKSVVDSFKGLFEFLNFIGEVTVYFFSMLRHPGSFRFGATVKHLESSGLQALPIIGLTSFLVGLVIAYQSAEQLRQFGANIFIVEMVSISVFRELSPMIAAIVVAGRSASAYTAEIGTMKITEEIDAMRTMGFHPQLFLILPRMIALMLAMPLIVFFADMVGMFGGMLIANAQLDITFTEFLDRLQTEVPLKHILIGLIKAPFFGFIIAAIGCFRGFQVTGSTDSIGNFTTVSVVNAIFWVIASNALISVFLTELGI